MTLMNSEVYKLYKPLRNHLRRVSIENAFYVVWAYINLFQFKKSLPSDIQTHQSVLTAKDTPSRGLYEWELSLLAREIMVNGEVDPTLATKSFNEWTYFSNGINKIKSFENDLWSVIGSKDLLRHELRRVAYRQFPWQARVTSSDFVRYYKIYNNPRVRDKVKDLIGLSTQEWYVIGTAIMGVFLLYAKMNDDPNIEILNITKEKLDIFLKYVSNDIEGFKEIITRDIRYDDQYIYSFNPLEYYPLVKINEHYFCPVINFLAWRITSGLYFDLIKTGNDFGHHFGLSFQDYLHEVSERVLDSQKIKIYKEEKYKVGKNEKDSVDLILAKQNDHFFIEAKAKRMQVESKTQLFSSSSLDKDLDVLAEDILQIYKTLKDYIRGSYCHIDYKDSYNIYPVIVTLEEWFLIGEDLFELEKKVKSKIKENNLLEIYEKYPYSFCSARGFELLVQILNKKEMAEVMKDWFNPERRGHDFGNFLVTQYGKRCKYIDEFFSGDFENIYPDLSKKK